MRFEKESNLFENTLINHKSIDLDLESKYSKIN